MTTDGHAEKRARIQSTREINKAVLIDGQVGAGTFGMVYKATDINTGQKLALKRIKMENESQGFPVTAIREIKILNSLRHVNIVSLIEIMISNDDDPDEPEGSAPKRFDSGSVFMVFEYCDFDLTGLMESNVLMTPMHVRSYMKQLLSGVHYMHVNKILHRDIKGANILVTRGNVLKIADWGLARSFYTSTQRLTNPVVTLWYRCPELLLETRKYGPEIDIWSVGCIFGELLKRKAMLPGRNEIEQLELVYRLMGSPTGAAQDRLKCCEGWEKMRIAETYTPTLREKFRSCSALELDLLERFLSLNPDTRITAAQANDHDYFWKPSPTPDPDTLPVFDIDGAHEFEAKQRLEEKRKRDHERMQAIQQAAESRGRGIAGRGRGQRPSGTGKPQNKFRGREVTATLTSMPNRAIVEATKEKTDGSKPTQVEGSEMHLAPQAGEKKISEASKEDGGVV